MARYYYGLQAQRSAVDEFLRFQYPDGSISATVAPDFKVDKATVVSDEETSTIVAAVEAFDVAPDPAWLRQNLKGQTLIERLNRAMNWVLTERRDPTTQLIKRAHTTDWGDVKWESGPEPTNMQDGDQWTVSIYDQAIGYAALRGLARLNAAAGREQDRARWEDAAFELRGATNRVLWQDEPRRGFYRIHVHLQPDRVEHYELDEGDVIAIGNAAAIYYGLADSERAARIVAALERARLAAGATKPGLTLDPPYPGWYQVQMDHAHVPERGAVGLVGWAPDQRRVLELGTGAWRAQHLIQVAQDWATHPGQVREWESPWLQRNGADQAYVGAAAVMGQAVVQGLFGVDISGREVRLTPRLHDVDGRIRVYEPATDTYAAYEYTSSPQRVSAQYGTNSPTAVSVRLPVLLARRQPGCPRRSRRVAGLLRARRRRARRVGRGPQRHAPRRPPARSARARALLNGSTYDSRVSGAKATSSFLMPAPPAKFTSRISVLASARALTTMPDAEGRVADAIAWSIGRLGARALGALGARPAHVRIARQRRKGARGHLDAPRRGSAAAATRATRPTSCQPCRCPARA